MTSQRCVYDSDFENLNSLSDSYEKRNVVIDNEKFYVKVIDLWGQGHFFGLGAISRVFFFIYNIKVGNKHEVCLMIM